MQLLVELIASLLVQVFVEVLAELGLRSLAEPIQERPNPWLAALGYVLFGTFTGGFSLFLFSEHLVSGEGWRVFNLIVTPVLAGLCMSALGAWRRRRGQRVLRIDRFAYGYLFALAFAVVRHLGAE